MSNFAAKYLKFFRKLVLDLLISMLITGASKKYVVLEHIYYIYYCISFIKDEIQAIIDYGK